MNRHYAKESEDLGCVRSGNVLIGEVRGVNDSGAELVEAFAPTRFELEQLAEHYFDATQGIELSWEVCEQGSETNWRQLAFCWRRLDTIAKALGQEGFRRVIEPLSHKWQTAIQKAREEKEGSKEALVDGL